MKTPNDFTPCEEYRGFVIAIRGGLYSLWNENGDCRGGRYPNRVEARRAVDAWLEPLPNRASREARA